MFVICFLSFLFFFFFFCFFFFFFVLSFFFLSFLFFFFLLFSFFLFLPPPPSFFLPPSPKVPSSSLTPFSLQQLLVRLIKLAWFVHDDIQNVADQGKKFLHASPELQVVGITILRFISCCSYSYSFFLSSFSQFFSNLLPPPPFSQRNGV